METVLGILIGIVASVIVGRYYYKRTFNKELRVFGLLNSAVFAGIAPDVRSQLHFRFQERDVAELQQLMFLVANTGDRAIRDLMAPLTLALPPTATILDASIVHRQPSELQATLQTIPEPSGGSEVRLTFPLLNSQEYFVVKLLLSGLVKPGDLSFHLLSEDLPRTLRVGYLPPTAFEDAPYKFEWSLAIIACVVLFIPSWLCYSLYYLWTTKPTLFPYPWATYNFTFESLLLVAPAFILATIFAMAGLAMLGAAIFGGEFPPPKGPRFPLPKNVRSAVFPFPMWRFHPEFGETPVANASTGSAAQEAKNGE
jgi:hypothetical protein